jgi:hypothetical protein
MHKPVSLAVIFAARARAGPRAAAASGYLRPIGASGSRRFYYALGTVSLAASPGAALSPIAVAARGGIAVAAGQPLGAHLPTTRIRFDGVVARAGVSNHFGAAR